MERTEILECLCSHDPRSPGELDKSPRKDRLDCACDNCFYGRDALAVEILDMLEELETCRQFCDSYM